MSDDIAKIVARKLRGLPLSDDEPQIAKSSSGGDMCLDCGTKPVAEKGSQAHAHGLCADCATWKRRHGDWTTRRIPGA
jgi:hypothetical protein